MTAQLSSLGLFRADLVVGLKGANDGAAAITNPHHEEYSPDLEVHAYLVPCAQYELNI